MSSYMLRKIIIQIHQDLFATRVQLVFRDIGLHLGPSVIIGHHDRQCFRDDLYIYIQG